MDVLQVPGLSLSDSEEQSGRPVSPPTLLGQAPGVGDRWKVTPTGETGASA